MTIYRVVSPVPTKREFWRDGSVAIGTFKSEREEQNKALLMYKYILFVL